MSATPTPMTRCLLALLLSLLLFVQVASAKPRNYTMDDTYGVEGVIGSEPQYSGKAEWRMVTNSDDCSVCRLRPDPSKMNSSTWHDVSVFPGTDYDNPAITLTFNGTALYVFCAFSGIHDDTTVETHLQLFINGAYIGDFDHTPDSTSPEFSYNQLVFGVPNLPFGQHTAVIALRNDIGKGTNMLFDYAIFTGDDGEPDLHSTTSGAPNPTSRPKGGDVGHGISTAVKVGLGIGLGVGVLMAVAMLTWFLCMRKRMKEERWKWKQNHEIPMMMSAIRNPDEATITGDRMPWR